MFQTTNQVPMNLLIDICVAFLAATDSHVGQNPM